jgi:protein phosphatase
MSLILRYAAKSDVGLVRAENEDSGYAGSRMLVVADGMGGHAAGELGAAAVATSPNSTWTRYPPGDDEVLGLLAGAIDTAHDVIGRVAANSPESRGMGTTLTALAWLNSRVALAHIGDSRAYLMRDGKLSQLTRDHTFVQTLVDAGRITPEEATTHERRNLLMKALDGVNDVESDLSIREGPGDFLLSVAPAVWS